MRVEFSRIAGDIYVNGQKLIFAVDFTKQVEHAEFSNVDWLMGWAKIGLMSRGHTVPHFEMRSVESYELGALPPPSEPQGITGDEIMRNLTKHIVEGDSVNHQLDVKAMDGPGSGGASHEYSIQHEGNVELCSVSFQNGPIKEAGVNGVTHEALLAILIDRMEGFQSGPFASDNNAHALDHLKQALWALQERTRQRIARGVEGTHTV